ncbi:MAG: tyrosine-type recombinase/integrase, partial [Halioglobus sp.]|nr:tyrosine-type recombinase/integrase [Halioglobus sp.]
MAELTHNTIKNLAVEKRSEIPDESYRHGKRRKGLMLQTNPSGNHVFLYRRLVNGTRYGFTLGRFPELPLGDAREMVDEINDYDGTPQEAWEALYAPKEPEQPKKVTTVGQLIHNYAIDCETVRKNRAWKAQQTVLNNELRPYLHLPADELTDKHVLAVVQGCLDRGSPRVAQEVLKQIKGMYARAMNKHRKKRVVVAKAEALTASMDESWLDIKANPAEGVTAPTYKPKSHHMEGKALLAFPKRLAASAVRDDVKQILLLQMQTFCRVGEVAGMAWEELDLKRRAWVIPGERYKTGIEHTVMLSKQSADQLRAIKKASKSAYV